MELFNKKGVEIFSVGTWNDNPFVLQDLYEMVKAFDETKLGVEPYLKLGHDKNQKLLQNDGLPAAGWVEKMYVVGDKLMADFKDIPKKIHELLERKAYKKVSVEMYNDLTIGQKAYKHLISAVSLLGADTPAVMNLSDILALYGEGKKPIVYDQFTEKPKVYEFETKTRKEPKMKTEQEIRAEIEAELKIKAEADKAQALETQVKEFTAQKEATDKELKELRAEKAKADKKAMEDAIALKESQNKAFITELKSEKLCSNAMEPLVAELLGEDKKEYSVKLADKEEKLSKHELLKQTLKLFSAATEVNFTESSSEGAKDNNVDEAAQEKQVQDYLKENPAKTYGQAVKAILAQNKSK